MVTTVDTSMLADVFGADARFGAASAEALCRCLNEGAVVACSAVWAETRVAFASDATFGQAMKTLGVGCCAPSRAAAELAGTICKKHRAAGGARERVISDFLIGAHAMTPCDRLLTRDRGHDKKHFSGLTVPDPSA